MAPLNLPFEGIEGGVPGDVPPPIEVHQPNEAARIRGFLPFARPDQRNGHFNQDNGHNNTIIEGLRDDAPVRRPNQHNVHHNQHNGHNNVVIQEIRDDDEEPELIEIEDNNDLDEIEIINEIVNVPAPAAQPFLQPGPAVIDHGSNRILERVEAPVIARRLPEIMVDISGNNARQRGQINYPRPVRPINIEVELPAPLNLVEENLRLEAILENVDYPSYARGVIRIFQQLRCLRAVIWRTRLDMTKFLCRSCLFEEDKPDHIKTLIHTLQLNSLTFAPFCDRCSRSPFPKRNASLCKFCMAAYVRDGNRQIVHDGGILPIPE